MNIRRYPVLCLALLTPALYAQKPGGSITNYPAIPLPGGVAAGPISHAPLIVPLFMAGDHFSSTLTLSNFSTVTTYADVTVRGLDGKTLATQRVNFTPHSQRQVDIDQLLAAKNSSATAGSILVLQSSALMGPSILATLSMTYSGSADPNYIDEEIFMPSPIGSQILRGVADRTDGAPIVAVSSVAKTTQHVKVECLGEHGASAPRQITLAAGETQIMDACAAPEAPGGSLASILDRMDATTHGPQGILLTSDATPGSFAAFAMAPHGKTGDRYFSSVLFADPKTINSPNTVFTGVPVGPATLLPAGNYTPHLSVTNFSANEVHVHTTFARTSNHAPISREVGVLTVPPMSSRNLILRDLQGDPDLQNSFIISSDGAPGALMAKLVSKSDSRLREVELQAKDGRDPANAGVHPWSLEQGTESTLLLFNHSDVVQIFNVSVSGSDVWQKAYKLAPMETMAISIGELIDEQVKDDKGRTIPKTAQSGEVSWFNPNTSAVSGRLIQSDRSTAMARNFSCGWSGLLCGAGFQIYESTLDDGTVVDYAELTPVTCVSGTQNACSGQQVNTSSSGFSYNWTAPTPTIATISGASTLSNSYVKGIGAGKGNIQGRVMSQYCNVPVSGPVTVQVPDRIVVANDVTQTINCGGYITTKQRIITYTIQAGTVPLVNSVPIYENVPVTSSTCSVGNVKTGSTCEPNDDYSPNSVNQFDDFLQACPVVGSPNPCGFSFANQQWQYCKSDGTRSSIGTVGPVTVLNTKITVDGNSTTLVKGTTFK